MPVPEETGAPTFRSSGFIKGVRSLTHGDVTGSTGIERKYSHYMRTLKASKILNESWKKSNVRNVET